MTELKTNAFGIGFQKTNDDEQSKLIERNDKREEQMEISDFIYKFLRYVRAKLLWQNKKHFRNLSNLLLSI